MNSPVGGSGLDHRLRDLECMEGSSEARLRVCDDRGKEMRLVLPRHVLLLVLPSKGVVDPSHDVGHAVGRVEAEVGVHLPRVVRVRGDLPSAQVDGLKPGPDLLDRLVPREGSEGRDKAVAMEELPESFGPKLRERVSDSDRTAQSIDIRGAIGPHDARPSIRHPPIPFQISKPARHRHSSPRAPATAQRHTRTMGSPGIKGGE
jgi:hypothetical protein